MILQTTTTQILNGFSGFSNLDTNVYCNCRHNKFVDRRRSYVLTPLPIDHFKVSFVRSSLAVCLTTGLYGRRVLHGQLNNSSTIFMILSGLWLPSNHHCLLASAHSRLSRYYIDTTSSRREKKSEPCSEVLVSQFFIAIPSSDLHKNL